MSQILMAFYCGTDTLPPFYEGIIKELGGRGHSLLVYPHKYFGLKRWDGAFPDDVKNEIQRFSPELCIFFNNAFFDVSSVVDCPILVYESDTVLYYSNMENVYRNPEMYYFFCGSDTREILIKNGIRPDRIGEYIPFTGIKREYKEIQNNIVFIGSKFISRPSNEINAFLQQIPTKEERMEYKAAIRLLREYPYLSLEDLIAKGALRSEKVISNFNIWQLRMELSGEKRIEILSSVSDLGLELFGTENWAQDYIYHTDLTLSYSYRQVCSLKDNQDVYNSAKIGISVGHLQAKAGFPWRVLDIMASNACLVSDYHSDFDKWFPADLFPVYESSYQAREICKELLDNENKRKEIVQRCQRYVAGAFSFERVRQTINRLLGRRLI